MWDDKILEKIHRIREDHAKSFNYDLKAICEDWRQKQAQSGKELITLTPKQQVSNTLQQTEL